MSDSPEQSEKSSTENGRAAIESMDPQILDIQPGGGVVIERRKSGAAFDAGG